MSFSNKIPVYRWSEDSDVAFQWDEEWSVPAFYVRLGRHTILVEPRSSSTTLRLLVSPAYFSMAVDHEYRKKLLGFVLDIGAITRPVPYLRGCLATNDHPEAVLDVPYFVPDEVWARRYETEPLRGSSGRVDVLKGAVLGPVEDLEIIARRYVRGGDTWQGQWSYPGRMEHTTECLSVEEVVDQVAKRELLLPESYRELWEPSNVERGTWLFPSADEVSLYQMLGEPLPFFWPRPRLSEWLLEQFDSEGRPRSSGNGKLETGDPSDPEGRPRSSGNWKLETGNPS